MMGGEMVEEETRVPDRFKGYYLTFGLMYPLILILIFLICGFHSDAVPFSLAAFNQPYSGPAGVESLALLALALAELAFINLKLIPDSLADPSMHLMAIVLPEIIGLDGLIIGFINVNAWASIPYILVAFANYYWVYRRINADAGGDLP
jgi:hypothetical protein